MMCYLINIYASDQIDRTNKFRFLIPCYVTSVIKPKVTELEKHNNAVCIVRPISILRAPILTNCFVGFRTTWSRDKSFPSP